jgi:putative phage-type endonuclease
MSDHRIPYVGDGLDGCRRSAQMDREEADGLDLLDPRIDELLASADRWEAQAADLEDAQEIARTQGLPLEAAHAVLDKLSEPRGYTIEGSAFLTDDHEFRKPPTPQEIATAVKDAPFNVTGLTSDGVFLLPAPNENTRTVVSKRGHLAMADALYARGRRDTPTGTVIARLDPISDRANWLAVRRTGIGSSDVPILLGLSTGEYAKSELDLYMDKRGEVPDDESGEAALWGTLLEDPVAREWARRENSRDPLAPLLTVQKVGTIAHREHRHMLCDLDRRVIGCPDHERCALEVKTRSAYKAADWADGVPEDTLSQVMHQLAVTGYDAIHVAALIGGQKLVTYVVEPDADMIADLFAIEDQFWTENVLAGVPPEISSLDLLVDHLKHFTPVKGVEVEVHGADAFYARNMAHQYDAWSETVKDLENVKKELMALIGPDGTDLVAVDDEGNREVLFTWRSQAKPKQLDKPAVEAVLGAPLDSFKVSTGTTRVLRRVKPRSA